MGPSSPATIRAGAATAIPPVRASARFSRRSFAREPVESRPTIRGWLPRGFVLSQVPIVSARPSTAVMMVRSLEATEVRPSLSGDDVLYWRSDIF